MSNEEEIEEGIEDPEVPTDLLELHVLLEEETVSPEEFKEVFGNDDVRK